MELEVLPVEPWLLNQDKQFSEEVPNHDENI
jgi:hypothetical protein